MRRRTTTITRVATTIMAPPTMVTAITNTNVTIITLRPRTLTRIPTGAFAVLIPPPSTAIPLPLIVSVFRLSISNAVVRLRSVRTMVTVLLRRQSAQKLFPLPPLLPPSLRFSRTRIIIEVVSPRLTVRATIAQRACNIAVIVVIRLQYPTPRQTLTKAGLMVITAAMPLLALRRAMFTQSTRMPRPGISTYRGRTNC